MRLSQLKRHQPAMIIAVANQAVANQAIVNQADNDRSTSQSTAQTEPDPIGQRLMTLGFIPGEQVVVLASGLFGRDPLLVQIGFTRFALRRTEADRIQVEISA